MIDLQALGDRAVLARFATEEDAARWAIAVRARGWPGVVDVAPAYRSVAVFADPDRVELEELEARLRSVAIEAADRGAGARIMIPVRYDGEDLPEVAARLGLTPDEVVAAHSGRDYQVYAIGFLPGFPYAGYLPESLRGLPRRDVPRVRVPAGAVAIVGRQTAVYPEESPGGWHLIGRTPLRIVDLERGHFPIRAGDTLRFMPIDAR
ncbi:MAG TPA: allophanate hydrolase subunit 1, partial [Isosphaeraceae bacterium]